MEDYLHIQKPDLGYRRESGPGAWEVLDYEPFMDINRHLIATDELTIHRSAAIIRRTGSAPVGWHTDWCGYSTEDQALGRRPQSRTVAVGQVVLPDRFAATKLLIRTSLRQRIQVFENFFLFGQIKLIRADVHISDSAEAINDKRRRAGNAVAEIVIRQADPVV